MPENNTQPSAVPTPPATAPAPTFTVGQNLSASTVSGVIGATTIENQNRSKSSVAVWIGFGLILIAMAIAGSYYYMTMIEPDVGEVLPPEVNVPIVTNNETTVAELDAVSSTLDASVDLTDVEQDIDAIGDELDTVQ